MAAVSTTMWHYLWQNQQIGPIPEGDLRQSFATGRLSLETLVWTQGMAQWAPAFQVAAFQPVQAPAPQPALQPQAAAVAGLAGTLSPSEVVFFHAERFAAPGSMLNSLELVHVPQKVKGSEVGQAIMAVAFLAAEQAGAITLTMKEQKALFGLKTNKVLEVGRGSRQVTWPAQSFEAGIDYFLQQGKTSVGDIVYALLLEDAHVPAIQPYRLIREQMVQKGLVAKQEQKGMLGAVTYHYSMTPAAAQAASSHDPTPWLQLLTETQRTRTDFWGALASGIQNGFSRRQEVDTSSDGPDLDFD